jgi:hypothetical protein
MKFIIYKPRKIEYNMHMNKEVVLIDTLENDKFVMLDYKYNSESVISAETAYKHYMNPSYLLPIEFSTKALDEIQNAIEDELVRQEESSAASYAPAYG